MADIRIYGTLRNDTGEAAVYSSQVLDEGTGKTLDAIISGKATPADVATAKQEAITAAATSAAGLYVPKTDMPTFTEYTAAEIQAIADAAVAAL